MLKGNSGVISPAQLYMAAQNYCRKVCLSYLRYINTERKRHRFRISNFNVTECVENNQIFAFEFLQGTCTFNTAVQF